MRMSLMRALVTGAAGFVGRTLIERLLVSRHQVRGFVRTTSRVESLRGLGIELCYGDLRDLESLDRAVRGVDVVFHAAARVGVWGRPEEYYEANVLGTRHVLQAMRRSRVARLIHFSSVAVYGRNTGLIKETRALQRIGDAHGDTKIDAEEMVRESALSHGLAITVLRPALVYGPFDYKYVPRTARNIVNGHMRIVGSGQNIAPIIYGEDLADLAIRAADSEAAVGQIFNVASCEPVTWQEFLSTLANLLGTKLPRVRIPYPLLYGAASLLEVCWKIAGAKEAPPATRFGTRMLGSDWRYDINKAKSLLGFQPKVGYREGLSRTVDWVREERLLASPSRPLSPAP
jgi:nucleoside-diphosphate-sugar epimerase